MTFLGHIGAGWAARSDAARLHFIEAGRVTCPQAGDIDLERCLACPALIAARLEGQSPSLRCRGAAGSPGMARLSRIV